MSQLNTPPVELDAGIADYLKRHFPGEETRFYHPVKIGSTAEEARKGAQLVLSGVKTATSSASWHYPDGKLPFVGALSVLIDDVGNPLAILETTRVAVTAFGAIDDAFAFHYGEGDRSLDWFRAHIGAWYREEATRYGVEFDDETELICEWFTLHCR
jgi:uncharacterized protein YhfF